MLQPIAVAVGASCVEESQTECKEQCELAHKEENHLLVVH